MPVSERFQSSLVSAPDTIGAGDGPFHGFTCASLDACSTFATPVLRRSVLAWSRSPVARLGIGRFPESLPALEFSSSALTHRRVLSWRAMARKA